MLEENASMMNSVVRNSAMQQIRTVNDILKEKALSSDNEKEDAEMEPEKSIFEKFAPLLERFLPILLKDDTQSKVAIAAVRSAPDFKQLVGDKVELNKAIKLIETKCSPEESDRLLKAFKIKRAPKAVIKGSEVKA
jgi:hypothetical protein